jgi:alkylation response protein AidB-like acyl-CoA dehydrogenase
VTVQTDATPVLPGSPELAALLARVAAGSAERERDGVYPHAQTEWLREAGLGRLRVPVADGGAGATVPELFAVVIDLAAADSNAAHALRTHFSFVEQAIHHPSPKRRGRWLELINAGHIFGNAISEQSMNPVGLEPGARFETTLEPAPDGDGYRLNGAKFYSTGTLFASWTQVYASKPDGTTSSATIPTDREGLTVEDDWDGFGQRHTGTGTTRFDDVHVDAREVSDFPAPDEDPRPTYQGAFLQLYLQALTAGILQAVREDAAALVRRRRRGFSHAAAESPTADPQVLQVVGEIAAEAFAARAIMLAAATAIQTASDSVRDGVPTPEAAQAASLAAAQAKVAIDRFSYATAAHLFDAGGASATQQVHNLDRHWRNVRTVSTHNPTHLKASAIGAHIVNGDALPNNGYF